MPAVMTILNPAPDEESDENISLDLQVSDPEDIEEEPDKEKFEENGVDVEDEEAILNKFEEEETQAKTIDKTNDDNSVQTKSSGNKDETPIESKENEADKQADVANVSLETSQNENTNDGSTKETEEEQKEIVEEPEQEPSSETSSEENSNCDKNTDESSVVQNETDNSSINNTESKTPEEVGDSDFMEIDEECTKNESIKDVNTSIILEDEKNTNGNNSQEKSNESETNDLNDKKSKDDTSEDGSQKNSSIPNKINEQIPAKPAKRPRSTNKYEDKSDTYEISETKETRRSTRRQESLPILTIRRSTRRRKLSNASEESNISEGISEASDKSEDLLKLSEDEGKKISEVKKVKTSKKLKQDVKLKDEADESSSKENYVDKENTDENILTGKTSGENVASSDTNDEQDSIDKMDSLEISIESTDSNEKTGEMEVLEKCKDGEGDEEVTNEKSNDAEAAKVEVKNDEAATKEDSDELDGEDLLLVMDEKSPEADVQEEEEENSGGEEKEKETDDLNRDQDVTEPVSPTDDTMDIEEDLLGEDNNLDSTTDTLNETVIEKKTEESVQTEDNEVVDVIDEESETKTTSAPSQSLLATILTSGPDVETKDSTPKAAKRSLASSPIEKESSKKIKLSSSTTTEAAKPLKRLASFRQFMLDSRLVNLTRNQLEDFCIQKMGECIAQKSEIGELKLKIKAQEQLLDCLRKDTIALGKQTRDLNIVHQKVMNDINKMTENNDKPLIVPKITRSVGLQAIVRDDAKKKTVKLVDKTTKPSVVKTPVKQNGRFSSNNNNNNNNSSQQKLPIPRVVQPQVVNKNKVPIAPKKADGDNKGVIDLTDEDDKKVTSKPVKINMINAQPGHKLVMMPNGQAVMVKLATPGVVVSQPLLRTVQSTNNGVIRSPTTQVRQTVRAVLTPTQNRPRAPNSNSVGSRMPARQTIPVRTSKHPAPLPHPPPIKPDVKSNKPVPPKPQLMLNKTPCGTGIVLSWKMPYKLDMFEDIASYQLYAYQETKAEPRTENWGKIGDVKALELPMAVTLTQFAVGNRYFFAVRAVDVLSRHGAFSECQTILL